MLIEAPWGQRGVVLNQDPNPSFLLRMLSATMVMTHTGNRRTQTDARCREVRSMLGDQEVKEVSL